MADENKDYHEKELFNVKGHSLKTIKETFNSHTIDAMFNESEGKVEAFIKVEGPGMEANHYKELAGNGEPAKQKALDFYNEVKKLYSKKEQK